MAAEEHVNPEPDNMDEVSRYWVDEAEEALAVLEHLFEKGDYSYALFFGHLAIEKMLKGLYVTVPVGLVFADHVHGPGIIGEKIRLATGDHDVMKAVCF